MKNGLFLLVLLGLYSGGLCAETRIAILDFELKDLTLAPGIPSEIKRTASIKPLLEKELGSAGYVIVPIPLSEQHRANSGIGYLFDHGDAVAALGQQFGADYVLVGRLHKPSFLFAYLMGNLVRVRDQRVLGHFITESKGPNLALVVKAVENLADKIDNSLENRYSPPLPGKLK